MKAAFLCGKVNVGFTVLFFVLLLLLRRDMRHRYSTYLLSNGRTRTATRTEAIVSQKQSILASSVFSRTLRASSIIHS